MRTLHEQLSHTFGKTGWSVQELLDKSGLDIERSSLDRKLKGELPMKTLEAEVLASTLRKHGFDVTLTWPTKTRRSA